MNGEPEDVKTTLFIALVGLLATVATILLLMAFLT